MSASSKPPSLSVSARGGGQYPRFAACSLRLMPSLNGPVTPRFPLRPDPVPRETVPSFLSRLAAMRRTEMAEFARNMGFSVRRFLDGDPEALAGLVTWGGVTPAQLAELQSWSGEAVGEVRTRFRGGRSSCCGRFATRSCGAARSACARMRSAIPALPPRSWRCAAIGSCAT
ncbi:TniQ family protein [Rhodobacter capsulatus]